MTQQAKDFIRDQLPDFARQRLQKSKGKFYCCPFCDSGKGKGSGQADGALLIYPDTNRFFCHACKKGGDIFDLYGRIEGIPEGNDHFKERIDGLGKYYGVDVKGKFDQNNARSQAKGKAKTETKTEAKEAPEVIPTYKPFFYEAHQNVDKTDYFEKRGLSKQIIERFQLGFVENWTHPSNPKGKPTDRAIIPITESSYLARDVRDDSILTDAEKAFSKPKIGSAKKIFNIEALDVNEPVFICEGEFDALSIIEAGGNALALGGTGNGQLLVNIISNRVPKKPIILCLDDDEAGHKTQAEMKSKLEQIEGLKGRIIESYPQRIDAPPPEGKDKIKDPNEALMTNCALFRRAVKETIEAAEEIENIKEQAEHDEYIKTSVLHNIENLRSEIERRRQRKIIKTGFDRLDKILGGGLDEALYSLGGISGLGKTTFALQICDNIAKSGHDVLIFSLEMSKFELMSKSLSRITYQIRQAERLPNMWRKSAKDIRDGNYLRFAPEHKAFVERAIKEYSLYAGNLFINEGVGNISIENIREAIERHIHFRKTPPVVLIDYLQIIPPIKERFSERQSVDFNVSELKRMSRALRVPIVLISSLNRQNYQTPIDFASFKESGSIEYTSDVVLGIQLAGIEEATKEKKKNEKLDFDFDEKMNGKKNNPEREIEIKVLKNRHGKSKAKIEYLYNPIFDVFEELPEDAIADDEEDAEEMTL